MIRFATAFLVAAVVVTGAARAAEPAKKLKVGDVAPTFSSLEGTDGKTLSLSDLKDKEVVVIAITCNHCPVAIAYEDRINAFVKKNAGADSKVAFVAINVNKGEADSMPKMKVRATDKGFTFPYLIDPSQKIARDLGASVTPEFYVLDKERKVVYMGAMDSDSNADKAKENYLEPAVEAALKGAKPDKTEVRARGCGIKYEGASKSGSKN